MTKKRRTDICILIIITIAMLMVGCATKKKTVTDTATNSETTKVEQVNDSTIVETHDTTKITQRLVPTEVDVPAAHMERTTNDTTSVLETDLYKSMASWKDGILHHTLDAKPGAKVKGKVVVTDTTKSSSRKNEIKSTSNNSTNSKKLHEATQKTAKTDTPPGKMKWLAADIIIGIAIAIFIIWRYRKRRQA